jgi:hypothetical protein
LPYIIDSQHKALQETLEAARRVRDTGNKYYKGCLPREVLFGCLKGVPPSSFIIPRIPRDQWKRLIVEGKGTWLGDLSRDKLKPHDQGSTLLCWMHGSVRGLELLRVWQNQPPILLSAECAASQVTGGKNRGGMPEEAIEQLRTIGTCDQSLWPLNQLSQSRALPGWKEDQRNHVLLKYVDVENWDDQITLALHRIPVPIGLRWWNHLVCQTSPVILPNGEVGIEIDNSWGTSWGDNGRGQLNEKYGTADLGAFAPISETFSLN